MENKKVSANWYVSIKHCLIAGLLLPAVFGFAVPLFLGLTLGTIAYKSYTSYFYIYTSIPLLKTGDMTAIVVFIITLAFSLFVTWLAVVMSFEYLSKKHVINDPGNIIKLSTIYLIIGLLFYVLFWSEKGFSVIGMVAISLRVLVFYFSSRLAFSGGLKQSTTSPVSGGQTKEIDHEITDVKTQNLIDKNVKLRNLWVFCLAMSPLIWMGLIFYVIPGEQASYYIPDGAWALVSIGTVISFHVFNILAILAGLVLTRLKKHRALYIINLLPYLSIIIFVLIFIIQPGGSAKKEKDLSFNAETSITVDNQPSWVVIDQNQKLMLGDVLSTHWVDIEKLGGYKKVDGSIVTGEKVSPFGGEPYSGLTLSRDIQKKYEMSQNLDPLSKVRAENHPNYVLKEIARSKDKIYYCLFNCYLYISDIKGNNVAYTNIYHKSSLTKNNGSRDSFYSPDGKKILLFEPQEVKILDFDLGKVVYLRNLDNSESFGVMNELSNFIAEGKWLSDSEVYLNVYASDDKTYLKSPYLEPKPLYGIKYSIK